MTRKYVRAFALGSSVLMLLVGLQGIVQNLREDGGAPEKPSRVQSLGMTTNPYVPSSQSILNGTQTGGSGWNDLKDSDNVRYTYQEVNRGTPTSASLLPNANGDTTSWTVKGGTGCNSEANEWNCTDDDPNDGDTTYIKSTAKTVTDSLENLGTVNLQGGTVSNVTVWIWCRKIVSQSVGVRTLIKTHGSLHMGDSNYNCPNSSTYGSTSKSYPSNPSTTQPWTQSEIDALQAGCRDYDGSTREVRCSEVRVDVTYTVPKYSLEVRFAWSSLPLTGDAWTLVAEGNRSNPGSEPIRVEVGQGGSSPTSWVTAYMFNTDGDTSYGTYALSAGELNGGAPVVRIWDNQGSVDTSQGTMGLDVLRIDVTEYRTGRNPWHYYVDGAVNADTGSLHLDFADLTVKALGWNLRVARSYNSGLRTQDGLLGFGWTFAYDTKIVESTAGIANWYDPDGSVHTFRQSGGAWVAPPGVDAKLTKSGTFTLWFKDGSTNAFNSIGRLVTMTDRNGNAVTVTWNPIAPLRITNVADASGKQLNFTYGIFGPIARIRQVFDPIGRSVSYAYDGNGDLRTVTDAAGNNTYFTYDAHRLRTWREPAWSMVYPPPSVRKVTYSYDGSDRVVEIKHASVNAATNATQYEYRAWGLDYVPVSSYPGAVRYANATNGRSKVTTIDVDAAGSPLRVMGPPCGTCACFAPSASCSSSGSCGSAAAGNGCDGGSGSPTEQVEITWDANRNVLTKEDKGAHGYVYTYDAWRNLLNTTDPMGNVTRNVWTVVDNGTAYVSTVNKTTNARGYTWWYEYTAAGNVKQTKDPTNNVSKREYDAKGYVKKVTDWRGYNSTFDYDAHGYLLNRTDATDNKTTFQYDGVGRQTRITHPDGHYARTEYDANDRVTKRIDEANNATLYVYNARGDLLAVQDPLSRATGYEWNVTNHKLAQVINALGNDTLYAYDLAGNLVKVTNPRGYDTTHAYDDFNRRTVVKDALNNETQYTYDEDGLVTSMRNRREYRTNYTYDRLHRVLTVKDVLGNVTTYAYDQVGNRVSVRDARGYFTNSTYDALNRLTLTTNALENITQVKYDANGNVVNRTDANGNSDTFAYDPVNRRTAATNGEGKTTTFAYDSESNLVRERDANGRYTNFTYNALNRLKVVTDALGNTTTYDYDAVGNLRNLTDANGHTTRQAYDALNRLTNSTTPLGKTTLYTYDENGYMKTRKDPKGNTTTYTFDALDRLTRIDYPNGTYLTATYDAEGNTITATGFGTSRTDAWDALNRVTSITFNFGAFAKTVNYTYDEVGNRKTMRYPEGQVVTYTWDGLDRLGTLQDSILGSWTFEYDAGSRRTKLTHPSGLTTTYAYNKAGWTVKIETKTSGGAVRERFNYTHDSVGNKLTVVEESGNTTTYGYDGTYRLTSESYTGGLVVNYTYDGVGNRLTEFRGGGTTNYAYDADNRLTAKGTTTYGYDDNGNTVSRYVPGTGSTTYAYDLENHLLAVSLPNGTAVQHTYSVRGNRVSTTTSGVAMYMMYDFYDLSRIRIEDRIADYALNGSLVARYVHGPGADEPLAMVRGSTFFYSANAIGTVTTLTTSAQTPSASYEYEAFGVPRVQPESAANPYAFTGREFDLYTGAYYYRARWYEPGIGRFHVGDPWKHVDGLNLYLYAGANPITKADPKGLLGEDCRIPCFNGGYGGGGGGPMPQCADRVDNDGDGRVDYPADPGCSSVSDNDEADPTRIIHCRSGPPPTGQWTWSCTICYDQRSCDVQDWTWWDTDKSRACGVVVWMTVLGAVIGFYPWAPSEDECTWSLCLGPPDCRGISDRWTR